MKSSLLTRWSFFIAIPLAWMITQLQSPALQASAQDDYSQSVIEALFEEFDLPEPLADPNLSGYDWQSMEEGRWEYTSTKPLDQPIDDIQANGWAGIYFDATRKILSDGKTTAAVTCSAEARILIVEQTELGQEQIRRMKSQLEDVPDKTKINFVQYKGTEIFTFYFNGLDAGGSLDEAAVWEQNGRSFIIIFITEYRARYNDGSKGTAPKCPFDFEPLDLPQWYQALHDLGQDYASGGLSSSGPLEPGALPTLTPTPPAGDRDGDGIPDNDDLCANMFGEKDLCGCPQNGPAAGDLLFRFGAPSYGSFKAGYASSEGETHNFGHTGMYAGDMVAPIAFQVRHANGLMVYRPNTQAGPDAIYPGYDYIKIEKGDQVKPGDIVPDAVIESDYGYGGVGISNLSNFKGDNYSFTGQFDNIRYGYPRTRISCAQRKDAIDTMLALANMTDEGRNSYSIKTNNCADAVSTAYDLAKSNLWQEYVKDGQVLTPNYLASWMTLSELNSPRRDFNPNASLEPEELITTYGVHSPVYIQLTDSNGRVTGVSESGLTSEIPGTEVWVSEDGAKMINVFGQGAGPLTLSVQGYDIGTYTLSVFSINYPGAGDNHFAAYPIQSVTPSTRASLSLDPATIDPASWALAVDHQGDQIIDEMVQPAITPIAGKTGGLSLPDIGGIKSVWIVLGCGVALIGGLVLVLLVVWLVRRQKSGDTPSMPAPAAPQHAPSSSRLRNCLLVTIALLLMAACCAAVGYFGKDYILNNLSPSMAQKVEDAVSQDEPANPPVQAEDTSGPQPQDSTLPAQPTAETGGQESSTVSNVPAYGLSPQGPWILFQAEDGLWGLNPDGSGLTHLVNEAIVAPTNLEAGLSPNGSTLAFVTASDAYALHNLTLKMIHLPEGTVETITALTSANTEPGTDSDMCDPRYEAARAVTIEDGLGWSRDGTQLAFIGAMQGPTADLFVYSRLDGSITRLTNGPSQAYGVYWSNSDTFIVHFGASCFGTGAGFNMMGAWAAYADNRDVIDLYTPNTESFGEIFIANEWSPVDAFYVATASGCPLRDLRRVEIETQAVTMIYPGCFDDVAVGPTNMLALVSSQDFTSQPGLYLYQETNAAGEFLPPVYMPEPNARQVEISGNLALVEILNFNQPGSLIGSYDLLTGSPGDYSGKGDFPQFSPDDQRYTWLDGETFYYQEQGGRQPRTLSNQRVYYPFWYEEVGAAMGDVRQHLLYFAGQEGADLYLASAPDYIPVLIADGLLPQGMPLLVFASH